MRRNVPVVLAIVFGLATLIGLLVVPDIGTLLTGWLSLLAAFALVLGILNLLAVHLRRSADSNWYSIILVVSMLAILLLAVSDQLEFTEGGVDTAFDQVQLPLSAALGSLLAFFLLFAGFRLLQWQRSGWSVLFLLTSLFFLIAQGPLPPSIRDAVDPIREFTSSILVTSGVRGLLIGVSLATLVLSVRLLAGLERPYSR